MSITLAFTPSLRDEASYSVAEDVLTINGVAYDLGPLQDGDVLREGAIPSDLIDRDIIRTGAEIAVTITQPLSASGDILMTETGEVGETAGTVDWSLRETAAERAEAALGAERAGMMAYRLAFEDAAGLLAYGPGTLLQAIDAMRAAVPPQIGRRYDNITIFERNRPEVGSFLQNPDGINLSPEQVDDFFRLCMHLEAGETAATWDGGTGSLALV